MRVCFGMLVFLLSTGSAWAWRCNGWIIREGQSLFEVGEKCGEPDAVEQRTEWRIQTTVQSQCQTLVEPGPASGKPPTRHGRLYCINVPVSFTVPVAVEEWHFREDNVPKTLHFENGRLLYIQSHWDLRRR